MGKFDQCLTELSARDRIMAGYYSLTIFLFRKIFFYYSLLNLNDLCFTTIL